MNLAIFDLDNTLLGGDSDYSWGSFLADRNIVDGEQYRSSNQKFYAQYQAGTLDIYEFLAFSLQPLAENSLEDLLRWRTEFVQEYIEPMILPKAVELVEKHREQKDTLLIITATNRFVTEPIAERFNIPHLLATEPEIQSERYTGKVSGTPCFQDGKPLRYQEWLQQQSFEVEKTCFYSDSHNDIPLLSMVDEPVAVDPDELLKKHAEEHGWRQISLR